MSSTRPAADESHDISGSHWPLLGTVVDVRASAPQRSSAERAERVVCDEIVRLEQVFSVFDEDSLLRRWVVDPSTRTTNEFDELLSLALRWQHRSGGAFNVATRPLANLWARAGQNGCRPSPEELSALVADMNEPPYCSDQNGLRRVADCSGLDLNAIAKGFIVDVAVEAAWRVCSLDSLTVSAGGDIAHRGQHPIQVGIEDPSNQRDGAATLVTVDVHNAAIATSGLARRGVAVGPEWVSHVVDPRTGEPAHGSMSVTVVAPDATTADVIATIVNVMEPVEGLDFVRSLDGNWPRGDLTELFGGDSSGPIICWIVDRHGEVHSNAT